MLQKIQLKVKNAKCCELNRICVNVVVNIVERVNKFKWASERILKGKGRPQRRWVDEITKRVR